MLFIEAIFHTSDWEKQRKKLHRYRLMARPKALIECRRFTTALACTAAHRYEKCTAPLALFRCMLSECGTFEVKTAGLVKIGSFS